MPALLLLSLLLAAELPPPSPPPLPVPGDAGAPASPSRGWFVSGREVSSYALRRLDRGRCGEGAAAVLRSTQPTKGFVTMMQVVQAEKFLGRRLRFAATLRTDAVTGWPACGCAWTAPTRSTRWPSTTCRPGR